MSDYHDSSWGPPKGSPESKRSAVSNLYGLLISDRLAYWLWRYRFWRYLRDGSRGKHPGEFPVLHVGHFEVGLREGSRR